MIKVVCDRCGKDVTHDSRLGRVGHMELEFKESYGWKQLQNSMFDKMHFCEKCMDRIIDFIKAGKQEDEETQSTEEEGKGEKSAKQAKRKVIDYGKVNALYNAGWSQQKIADEIGVCQNTVSHALRKYTTYMAGGYIWDAEDKKFIKK